ncbi:VOC family protein [Nocardioides sp. W7]|uniref:VOC family protein n=1 Tax=Nocardioides sp. W7 TaxID=2931390 RepID=UPI001FD48EBC|nr:VOC family protein [Nocardioides sp. W7]
MTTIPEQYLRSTVPHLLLDGASEAIGFYERALGAQELFRIPDDGGPIVHAEMDVEGSVFMLSDAHDGFHSPLTLGGTSVGIHLFVSDLDAVHARAVGAGADEAQAPRDMDYGLRSSILRDPFGHVWVLLATLPG